MFPASESGRLVKDRGWNTGKASRSRGRNGQVASVNAAGTHRYRVVSVRLGREFRWHHGLFVRPEHLFARSGFFIAHVPHIISIPAAVTWEQHRSHSQRR